MRACIHTHTHPSSTTYNTQAYICAYIHIHPHHITSHPYHHVAYIKIWQQAHFISSYGSNMDLISSCSSSYRSIHTTHQTSSSYTLCPYMHVDIHMHVLTSLLHNTSIHKCMFMFVCMFMLTFKYSNHN